jgi:hypothetical protein
LKRTREPSAARSRRVLTAAISRRLVLLVRYGDPRGLEILLDVLDHFEFELEAWTRDDLRALVSAYDGLGGILPHAAAVRVQALEVILAQRRGADSMTHEPATLGRVVREAGEARSFATSAQTATSGSAYAMSFAFFTTITTCLSAFTKSAVARGTASPDRSSARLPPRSPVRAFHCCPT